MTQDLQRLSALKAAIEQVVVGYEGPIELLLTGLMGQGHLLIEDVPGLGKTVMARTLARVSGLGFKRIQFTPDLLPSDVTGVNAYHPGKGSFEFQSGPVFTHFLLADELNRATPRTQSALLECMQERQVTVGGTTYPLPNPFITLATQNPIDMAGTFPLPNAQLDRFMLRIKLGYPEFDEELQILRRFAKNESPEDLTQPLTSADEIREMAARSQETFLSPDLETYIVTIIRATRSRDDLEVGASPRSALMLARAGRALAYVRGRDHVLPDDLQDLVKPVLAHRLISGRDSVLRRRDAENVLEKILEDVPVPMESS